MQHKHAKDYYELEGLLYNKCCLFLQNAKKIVAIDGSFDAINVFTCRKYALFFFYSTASLIE